MVVSLVHCLNVLLVYNNILYNGSQLCNGEEFKVQMLLKFQMLNLVLHPNYRKTGVKGSFYLFS